MRVKTAQLIIGVLIVIGFFGSLILLMWRPDTLSDLNREPVTLMIGALIAGFATLIGFFYGSSAGSAAKTEMLGRDKS